MNRNGRTSTRSHGGDHSTHLSSVLLRDSIVHDLDGKMGGNVKNSFCLLIHAYMYYLSEVNRQELYSRDPIMYSIP